MEQSLKKSIGLAAFLFTAIGAASAVYAYSPAIQGVGQIKANVGENLCIDVLHGQVSDGANIQTYTCKPEDFQYWYMTMDGEIRNSKNPRYCLDVSNASTAYGANVQVWHCNGTRAQRWNYTAEGELRSSVGTNHCLDVSGASSDIRTNIQVWGCNGTDAQKWSIKRLPWTQIKFKRNSDLCLEVPHGYTFSGADVGVWTCHNVKHMQWYFTPEGEIRSAVHANRCLDVFHGTTYVTSGSRIQTWECNGSDAQKWFMTPTGKLKSALPGDYCLDLKYNEDYAGNIVHLWECNDSSAQAWEASTGLTVSLMQVEGMLTISMVNGDKGYAITDPISVLQIAGRMEFNAAELEGARDLFSDFQNEIISDAMINEGVDSVVDLLIQRKDEGHTFLAEAISRFDDTFKYDGEKNKVEGRIKWKQSHVIGTDALPVELSGPEVSFIGKANEGAFVLLVGGQLVSIEAIYGDKDGTYIGIGVGIGGGLDWDVKYGENNQYGFKFDIKFVTVKIYVSGDDAEKVWEHVAYHIYPIGESTYGYMLEAIGWADGAAHDIEAWTTHGVYEVEYAISTGFNYFEYGAEYVACESLDFLGLYSCR